MYADDAILCCNLNANISEEQITVELSKICDSRYVIDISKTKYMFFHTISKIVRDPRLKIKDNDIERVTQLNFLGLILNANL